MHLDGKTDCSEGVQCDSLPGDPEWLVLCYRFQHPLEVTQQGTLSNWRAVIGDKGLAELACINAFSTIDSSPIPTHH